MEIRLINKLIFEIKIYHKMSRKVTKPNSFNFFSRDSSALGPSGQVPGQLNKEYKLQSQAFTVPSPAALYKPKHCLLMLYVFSKGCYKLKDRDISLATLMYHIYQNFLSIISPTRPSHLMFALT